MTRWILFASLLLAPVACGDDDGGNQGHVDGGVDCSTVTGVDTFSVGLSKTGDNGYTVEIVSADPAPPARNDNTWTVAVTDDTAAAATGRTIDVETWMPHHMHGSPIDAEFTEGTDGQYELDPINLFMPGVWEITVKVMDAAGETLEDEVLFSFCIEG